MGSDQFHLKPLKGLAKSSSDLLNVPVALLLMFTIRSLATNSSLPPSLSILRLFNDIEEGKGQKKIAQEKKNTPFLYEVEEY